MTEKATDTDTATEQHYNNNDDDRPSAPLAKLIIPENGAKTVITPAATINDASSPAKKKRRDKSDLGDDFVAPDGGWGWLVAIASGVSVLVTFAVAQQFGIIFRDYMYSIGITSSELTTIINTQIAVSALTGLLNGPLFRRFTYRQVALGGSVLIFVGIFLSVFAQSFIFYMVSFSFIYAFGRGLMVSASSMAVNTYFKLKRRTATAYQFGVAGLGPIILPHLATYLVQSTGVQGTTLIFAGLSLHTFACAMVFQPVQWHVKKVEKDAESLQPPQEEPEQFAEPETPILPSANDGWFGSRTSLNTLTQRNRLNSLSSFDRRQESAVHMQEMRRLNSISGTHVKPRSFSTSESIKEEELEHLHIEPEPVNQAAIVLEQKALQVQKVPEKTQAELEAEEDAERQKLPFYKKVIIFFDLDLLRDLTYVNLAMGMTVITFVEINFAILTPFILSDFGFNNTQIAFAMSLLGLCDLIIRFLIPLLTAKIPFSNRTFFIIGILGMCFGRVFLAYTRDFYFMIAIFAWLGLFKAFRTVFCLLIIPGYVPLKRLPAAAGLQLLISGIFSLVFGPLIGVIRDSTDYGFTLNFLNALNIVAIAAWFLEDMLRKKKKTMME